MAKIDFELYLWSLVGIFVEAQASRSVSVGEREFAAVLDAEVFANDMQKNSTLV